MEVKRGLRRTQSLRCVSASHDNKPLRTQMGFRGRDASVSQLVARYQNTVEVSTVEVTNHSQQKLKQANHETTTSPSSPDVNSHGESTSESKLDSPLKKNNEKQPLQTRTNLTRSKSMGSLQNSCGSIRALKDVFESKNGPQRGDVKRRAGGCRVPPPKTVDAAPAKNGHGGERESPHKQRADDDDGNVDAKVNETDAKVYTKELEVAKKSIKERRKTLGSIDFERIRAAQDDDRRRSIADPRDVSETAQVRVKGQVRVKAISALYLSKVAGEQASNHTRLAKYTPECKKQIKPTKMAEKLKDDPIPLRSDGPGASCVNISGGHIQPTVTPQPSKVMLHQQWQKCELRRLLKHTHPELKSLDGLMEEELAEVLGSETAGENEYEGEVFSRRQLFENCAARNKEVNHTHKKHTEEGTAEEGKVKRRPSPSEQPWVKLHEEGMMEAAEQPIPVPQLNSECEEQTVRVDVQSTKRMFERQPVTQTDRSGPKMSKSKVQGTPLHVRDRKTRNETCREERSQKISACVEILQVLGKSNNAYKLSENLSLENEGRVACENPPTSVCNSEFLGEKFQTRASLFHNNPFISENVKSEQSHRYEADTQNNASPSHEPTEVSRASEDTLTTNVKNRAQLFESMPFDKIRHQNKEERQTIVERMNQTLNSLSNFNAIHSHGYIVEVNETMLAKKAKYFLSLTGPKVHYEEVVEGGAQNFILQLLPRSTLKPRIVYLKEDDQGNVESIVVDAPVYQHQLNTKRDVEFKTANVVQLIEDMLSQDSSLSKGVILQEDENRQSKVTVYSLYNYAEGDVKRYCPPRGHYMTTERVENKLDEDMKTKICEVRKGIVRSTISCLLASNEEQTGAESFRPDVKIKGNVKLFRSCIEKGDYAHLKALQTEATDQELSSQDVAGICMETADERGDHQPKERGLEATVDVQPKQLIHGDSTHSTKCSTGVTCKNILDEENNNKCDNGSTLGQVQNRQVQNIHSMCSSQEQERTSDIGVASQGSTLFADIQGHDIILQAELVEVVDDEDEISNLQAAIRSLRQATIDAKALNRANKNKEQSTSQKHSEQHICSGIEYDHKIAKVEAGSTQENIQVKNMCCEMLQPPDSCIASKYVSERQFKDTEIKCADIESQEKPSTCSDGEQEPDIVQKGATMSVQSSATNSHEGGSEIVGGLQAALDSLERSSVNVTRGDVKAAMIYRNSKSNKKGFKNVEEVSHKEIQFNPSIESKSIPCETFSHREHVSVSPVDLSRLNATPPCQGETPNDPCKSSKKKRQLVGPKPAIPPKPEHLRVTPADQQLTTTQCIKDGTDNSATIVEMSLRNKGEQPLRVSMLNGNVPRKGLKTTDSRVYLTDSRAHLTDSERRESFEKAVQLDQKIQSNHQNKGLMATLDGENISTIRSNEISVASEKHSPQNEKEVDDETVDFHKTLKKFNQDKEVSVKTPPAKPKRVRAIQTDDKKCKHTTGDKVESEHRLTTPSNSESILCEQISDDKRTDEVTPGSRVMMREKKVKGETEHERRQRLSVHMDEIVRGNITAAMEIFDNLRKQEELQNILTKVEEIEEDASDVDVRALSGIFEDVPAWVVTTTKCEKEQHGTVERTIERSLSIKPDTESMPSMAHVFGDLERASEEILNLKEQTLSRLMDIEEAIRKALYSVSTLKSDSDIAGLSGLFKESLGNVQGSPLPGNIRKISIGSSKTKAPHTQRSTTITKRDTGLTLDHNFEPDVAPGKQRASPLCSPAFISIQSAARKKDKAQGITEDTAKCPSCHYSPKAEEKFKTTKTLKCKSATQYKTEESQKQCCDSYKSPSNIPFTPSRKISVIEVQTDPKGNTVTGTKTVTENFERDTFYSTTTSTVVTSEPGVIITTSPATYQVTTYPEVRLPINSKPSS